MIESPETQSLRHFVFERLETGAFNSEKAREVVVREFREREISQEEMEVLLNEIRARANGTLSAA